MFLDRVPQYGFSSYSIHLKSVLICLCVVRKVFMFFLFFFVVFFCFLWMPESDTFQTTINDASQFP